jgi:hypothetical protein
VNVDVMVGVEVWVAVGVIVEVAVLVNVAVFVGVGGCTSETTRLASVHPRRLAPSRLTQKSNDR